MHLFEAIIDANHRALAGDQTAGLHPSEFEDSLPIVALTCIDPRLNPLMPEVLGVPEEKFIWLRNAGNIIFDPMSSMTRTLALACAVKGGREIAIIGHTDCLVRKTSVMDLTNRFRALGIDRSRLPENLNEFFGLFASERQNVLHGVEVVRSSPLIGPKIPVHGLLVDIGTGKLEWLVNGYQSFQSSSDISKHASQPAEALGGPASLPAFQMGEMKFPEAKIGEGNPTATQWMTELHVVEPEPAKPPLRVELPPKPVPLPPRIRPKPYLQKARK
jgi:carbonic anhydrase